MLTVYDDVNQLTSTFGARSSTLYDWETRYAAYRWDEETGLYQVRYRYLHPTLGRWLSRDPLFEADHVNMFSYCHNRPTTSSDPTGLKCILLSNGMVYDTKKQRVVFWSGDAKATHDFIWECNVRSKLPVLGVCFIFLGFIEPDDPAWCTYQCPSDYPKTHWIRLEPGQEVCPDEIEIDDEVCIEGIGNPDPPGLPPGRVPI